MQAVRTSLIPSLKPGESGSSQGARRLTLRNALVVVQLSISVVVLVAGGLFVRSLENARDAFSPGFDADRMLSMRLDPGTLGYKAPRIEAVYRDVLRLLKEVPRIESASLVSSPPFGSHGSAMASVVPDGAPIGAARQEEGAGLTNAGPRYFQTMGIPIAAGRDFDERDTAKSTQVAILSEAEARRLFGSARNAIGKRIRANEDGTPTRLEVVGVVNDKSHGGGPGEENRVMYVPSLQRQPGKEMTLLVRASSSSDLISLREAVREHTTESRSRASNLRGPDRRGSCRSAAWRHATDGRSLDAAWTRRADAREFGLYGVISYAVSVRTREIGIRLALGAHATNVRALIIRDGMLLTALGLACRAHRLADGDARSPVDARQSAGDRLADVCRRLGSAHRDRARGLLCARAPRDANRSDCHPSRRVDRWCRASAFEGASSLQGQIRFELSKPCLQISE